MVGDYHDACLRWQGEAAPLVRNGADILVLPGSAVDVLEPGDGTLWLALEGELGELWAARESIAFRPLGRTLPSDGLTLLDAAWPLAHARQASGRSLTLPTGAADWALDEGREAEAGGFFLVLRLRPA